MQGPPGTARTYATIKSYNDMVIVDSATLNTLAVMRLPTGVPLMFSGVVNVGMPLTN